MCEDSIKTDQVMKIRINFHEDWICHKIISAEASLWMFDEYNKVWEQPLFVHKTQLYDSSLTSYKSFRNYTDIDNAIRCFKQPHLW